jgi:hypothetical protein
MDFGFKGPSCFLMFICYLAYLLVSDLISAIIPLSKNKLNTSVGELSSVISKFGFSPGCPENVGLFAV